MSLRALDLYHVAVPLKKPIRHASHERTVSDNLIVRATLATGEVGYGEGVPREYVTGETIESSFAALASCDIARRLGYPDSYREAADFLFDELVVSGEDFDPRGRKGNAARCALELALLDAFGQLFGQSLDEVVRWQALYCKAARQEDYFSAPRPVRYSGAITADTHRRETIAAWKMRVYGFEQVKIKVGVDGQDDPERLARMRRILGRRMDIRIDANESWSADEAVEKARALVPFGPTALEQPVPHAQVESLAELRPKLGIPVMLDESLCGLPDASKAIGQRLADLFNVRLSKCGGIGPSLKIVGVARAAGLGVQLGCHPGETGLLSAAGRHVAACVPVFRYVEGSYDRHVLARNLIVEDITFGYGGRAKPISGPGLGVTVDPAALEALTVAHREIRYD